jgi:hypothetical protein
MGYTRKKFKKGRRRMRKTFSKKNRFSRKRGGCPCTKKRTQNKMTGGGDCTSTINDLNTPIYDRVTSMVPYRN